ncbi:MAG: oxidoreductase [Demequinaceae bacterium]|nr:oxidoreductase [Demequinaceae bacterium]
MGLFSKKARGGKRASASAQRSARSETLDHLQAFVASHEGCEAFIEPPTRVTETTMVIVAETGEWTRRRFPDEATAMRAAKHFKIPAYDVNLSGYPSRMREWNERQRKSLG